MGLDSVELVMDLEETFHITIKDQEAEGIRTVGDIITLVRFKTKAFPNEHCLTSRTFYKLRHAILQITRPPPTRLRPNTAFNHALPLASRREVWPKIALTAGLDLPHLASSNKCANTVLAIALGGALLSGISASLFLSCATGGLLGLAILAVLGWLLVKLSQPFKRHVPSVSTLADLTRLVLARNFSSLASESDTLRDRELRDAVYQVIANCLKVDSKRLRPELRLVQDLNLD